MKTAETQTWSIVISGVDRSEASIAFRQSSWKSTWFDNASRFDDGDFEGGLIITIHLHNLDELTEALQLVINMRPTYGVQLCCYADFGAVKVNSNLCTKAGGFLVSSCTMTETAGAVLQDVAMKIIAAEQALHDLKLMWAIASK